MNKQLAERDSMLAQLRAAARCEDCKYYCVAFDESPCVSQMKELINGRTPEEIKSGLYAHSQETLDCKECPYDGESRMDCSELMCLNALAYIQHLESERDAALAKVPKWISAKERLPENAGKYIVCTKKRAVYCTAFRFFHGKGYFATDSNTHIAHWAPLPEPPEEEG